MLGQCSRRSLCSSVYGRWGYESADAHYGAVHHVCNGSSQTLAPPGSVLAKIKQGFIYHSISSENYKYGQKTFFKWG